MESVIRRTSIIQFFYLLRLSQWAKASFVLLGVFYSASLAYLPIALLAAFSFCLVASAVYIYNDLQDREQDRLHPHKCQRPLAAGDVSITFALCTLILLLLAGFVIAWSISVNLTALLGTYLLINFAYNHVLKSVPIVDVLCIACGFMLRVLAGTIGIGLPISWWLTLIATLVSFFIALCKRRLEKKLNLNRATRDVLTKYSSGLLDFLIIVAALGCFITYLFYTIYARHESVYFLLTLPFAAIGLWRFVWIAMCANTNDDPVTIFVSDNISRINMLCFLLLTLIALFK